MKDEIRGKLIKYYRLKKDMKQAQLANGICSDSYLSKIEKGNAIPSKEVFELLAKKLSISLDINSENDLIVFELEKLYRALTITRDPGSAFTLISSIDKVLMNSYHYEYLQLLELYKARYFLYIGQVKKARSCLDIVSPFDKESAYLKSKYLGVYHYLKKSFLKAYVRIEEAEEIATSFSIEDCEQADLSYISSLINLRINKNIQSLIESRKSLKIYQYYFDIDRSIDCFILLSIAYKRLDNFSRALKYLEHGKSMIKQDENMDKEKLSAIYQNIGETFSEKHESLTAIQNYEYSYNLKVKAGSSKIKKCISLFSIIKEYYKLGEKKTALQYLDDGIETIGIEKHSYYYHFNIYRFIITGLLDANIDFIKEAINFFDKQHIDSYSIEYSLLLSRYFEINGHYKLANCYNSYANRILLQGKNIVNWSEL